jgi:large subunit ribosomal protein L10Ae
MAHKLSQETVTDGIAFILKERKQRKFKESVELQIGLKDYDTQKDKRFAGSLRLPNIVRPKLKICLIGDAKHVMEATNLGVDIDFVELDELKKFNKEKKPIKKWAKQYALLIATDVLIKKIPVVLGPILNRIGMFPQVVTHIEPLANQVASIRSSVKF